MGMLNWYKESDSNQKKTFWACYAGWALDSYDMQIFSFLLPVIMATWALTQTQVGLIGTVALVVTALGGWIAGILADRYGRVKILMFTILWFTFFGVLAGFAQNYEQLLIARTLQGLGFGGEWAVGAALMAEAVSAKHKNKAVGFVQSGMALGWAGSVIVATILITTLPPEWSWRVVFWTGVIPALIVIYIRRNVKESVEFVNDVAKNKENIEKASFKSVFKKQYIRSTVFSSLLVLGLQAACYAILIWIPTLMNERGLSPSSKIVTILIMAVGAFAGFMFTAYLADKLGRKQTLIGMSILSWIVTVVYMLIAMNQYITLALGFFVGFSAIGMFAALGPFLSDLFPTHIRTTGMGFAYNVGKSFGALSVVGVGMLAESLGLATSIGLFCLTAYGLATISILLIRVPKDEPTLISHHYQKQGV
ncbi:MFS transporter [Acinetobacter indicus]|uniref:MFS transporter n=1 Tax=Acinetobacter indicus TaxID=756892 RepID=UPI00209AD79B|nr:MFS transporter [Acinetobacter indicus]MCO8088991.1 MFS transporter [Acinetobacter indicus]